MELEEVTLLLGKILTVPAAFLHFTTPILELLETKRPPTLKMNLR